MLAELQSDEELYRKELMQINEAISEMEINEPVVVSIVRKRKQIMNELHSAREESEEIERRCEKYHFVLM